MNMKVIVKRRLAIVLAVLVFPILSSACPAAGFYRTTDGHVIGGGSGGFYTPSFSFERVIHIDSLCNMEFQSLARSSLQETLYRERGSVRPGKEGSWFFSGTNCGINDSEECDSDKAMLKVTVNDRGIMFGEVQYDLLQGDVADSVKTRMDMGPQRAAEKSRFMVVLCIFAVIAALVVGFGST